MVLGFETSSSVSLFTIYELALNPDIQEKLRNEIKSAIEENNGKLTYDMLFSFKYLDMVVSESLRKYPPAFIMRKCTKDFRIPDSDLIIPKDTQLNINVFSFHRDPAYFPEPMKFDPERFSPENIKKIIPFTYLAFGKEFFDFSTFILCLSLIITFCYLGDGPRKCIGGRFGLMQSKMSVAKLVANFEICTNAKTTIPMKYSPPALFLSPIDGVHLTLKKL